jgi:hypothetical protein
VQHQPSCPLRPLDHPFTRARPHALPPCSRPLRPCRARAAYPARPSMPPRLSDSYHHLAASSIRDPPCPPSPQPKPLLTLDCGASPHQTKQQAHSSGRMHIVTAPVPPTLHSPCRHYFTCNLLSILRCARYSIFSYGDVDTYPLAVQPFHASLRCIPSALGTPPSATHPASLVRWICMCGIMGFRCVAFLPTCISASLTAFILLPTSLHHFRLRPQITAFKTLHGCASQLPLHITPARSTARTTPYCHFRNPALALHAAQGHQ